MPGVERKYKSAEEMEKKINEYFARFENIEYLKDDKGAIILDKQGKPIIIDKLPTTSELALFLGFKSRDSLWNYKKQSSFAYVLERAKLKLQTFWEPLLSTKFASGAQFWLANIRDGWKDPKQLEAEANKTDIKVAAVVYVNKPNKPATAQIPTIEAEVISDAPTPIAKPKRIASYGKKLGRPKSKGRPKHRANITIEV